jgi:tetratricopeptide (TPR) repeat protein/predicted Ser/Thr protein kinase
VADEDLVGRRVGHIRVERFLAGGGMGSVYVGFDETLERRVALKAIRSRSRLDPESRARFLREARVLSRLRHPHICQIHDYVESEGRDFLVLELVEGRGLDAALEEGLARPLAMRVAEQVAGVLVAAHEAGVVHRDLKPSNVMLTPDGQVKVLDFGLSRLVGEGREPEPAPSPAPGAAAPTVRAGAGEAPEPAPDWRGATVSLAPEAPETPRPGSTGPLAELATQHGLVIGTPEYMSPEQARGEPVSPASDVYSFGLLLQRLFTGASPYGGGLSSEELLRRAARGDTLPVAGVDPDLAALVARMKAPQPGARPSAAEVEERLRFVRGKPARTLRRLVAAAAVALLALFGAVMAFQAWRIGREAARANREAERARQEAAAAREVADFLVNVFEVSDPGEGRGRTVTARELLDEGAKRVRSSLADQPLTRARLMDAMGVVYTNLGLYDEALPLLQEAADVRAARLPANDPELAASLHDLATLHHHREAYDLAEPLYRRALAIREAALGADDPAVGMSLNHLAALLRGKGEYAAAVPLYERAIAISEKALGPDHPDVGVMCNNLGAIFRLQGDYARARPLYERSLRIAEKTRGPDHPDVATDLNNLGVLARDTGRLDEALALFERSLLLCEEASGPDHPDVAVTLVNLGNVRYATGDLEQAALLLAGAVAIFARALGGDSPSLVQARADLGRVRLAQGRLGEARALLEGSSGACRRLLARDPSSPRVRGLLASTLVELGRLRERGGDSRAARACWEGALEAVAGIAGDDGAVPFRNARAKALLLLGRVDEARPVVAALVATGWSDPDLLALGRARGLPVRPGG